jgi:hypothetical protein
MQKQSLNKRALTSMFMLWSFILLPLSGILSYFSRTPAESTVLKHFLMTVHNMAALIFLVAVIIHLSFN